MAKMTEVILPEQSSVESQDSSSSSKLSSKAAEEETKIVDGEVEQLKKESIEEKKDHVSNLAQTMEVQENITTNADSKYLLTKQRIHHLLRFASDTCKTREKRKTKEPSETGEVDE